MTGLRAAPPGCPDSALSVGERADLIRMRASLAALHEVAFTASTSR